MEYGMEIVDIDYRREGRGSVLRFYLDRAEGGVTIDELTHDEPPPGRRPRGRTTSSRAAISLEVSSPGINRRLRQPDHFRRYLGKRVRVRILERVRRTARSSSGRCARSRTDGIVVGAVGGELFIPFDNIAQANYEHDFAANRWGGGSIAEPR